MRERFFSTWSNVFSVVSLLSGSGVVVSLMAEMPPIVPLVAGGIVAFIQTFDQVIGTNGKARDHASLASEFLALERIMVMQGDLDAEAIRDLRAEVLSIEAREPPVKRYLDLIAHNQVARALGSDDIETLRWWQRLLAQYLPGDGALQR